MRSYISYNQRNLNAHVGALERNFRLASVVVLMFFFVGSAGCLLEYELDDDNHTNPLVYNDTVRDNEPGSADGEGMDTDEIDDGQPVDSFTECEADTGSADSTCDGWESETEIGKDCDSTAQQVVIFEESFENPDVTGLTSTDPVGWSQTHHPSYVGLHDEDTGLITTPFGAQALKVYGTSTVASTTEAILSAVLKENMMYTLTFHVAKRRDQAATGYLVELVAVAADGSVTVLDSAQGTGVDTTDMSHADCIVVTAQQCQGHLGKRIAIQLKKPADVDWRTNPQYDNLVLKARHQ